MKTISMRIRGAKTELEEAGESTDGMVESTAKLRQEILALSGVDIMKDENTFKSTYAIMDELSKKWEYLTDIQQASIIELMAGKHQGNVMASLLENFDTARKVVATSQGASNSMMKEHAKWSDSLEARLLKLKAAWQSLSQSFLESDFLKSSIELLKGLVEALDWLIQNLGVVGIIGLGTSISGIFKYSKVATEAAEAATNVASATTEAAEATANLASATTEAAEATANLASAATEGAEVTANLASTTTEVAEATANIASTTTEGAEAMTNLASATTEVAESMTNVASATTEAAEATANLASTTTEVAEATANIASTTTEGAEAIANTASATTEGAEAIANTASTTTEGAEAIANTASATTEAAEATMNLASAATEGVEATTNIASAAATAAKSFGVFTIVASAVVAAISLIYTQFKKAREEASKARQETISSSDEYLNAAHSFEQAYIKYSGKTSLTSEEEAELQSAIQGTVSALGDKAGALQSVINSSSDYLAILERIAKEEIKASQRAASEKKDAAAGELENAVTNLAGSSTVDISIGHGYTDINTDDKALLLAKEIGEKYGFYGNVSLRGMQNVYGFKLPKDADADTIVEYYHALLEYQKGLEDLGLHKTDEYKDVYNANAEAIGKMSGSVDVYVDALTELKKAEYQLNPEYGIPKTTEDYLKMREAILKDYKDSPFELRREISDSLDFEYANSFDLSSANAQARKFIGLIDNYGSDESKKVETLLNMRTAVNNNECTVGSYLSQLDDVKKMTEGWSAEEKEMFNTSFGIDADAIKAQYDDIYNYLLREYDSGKYKKTEQYSITGTQTGQYVNEADRYGKEKEIKKFLNGLSAYELEAIVNLKTKIDWGQSPEQIMQQIKEEAAIIEAMSFSINIDVETEKLESLSTAVTESLSGSGLKDASISVVEDMFGDLDKYDPSKLFEGTANGIRLNADEFRRLNDEYKKSNIDGLDKKMDALAERYNQTREELSDLVYGTDEYNKKARELRDIEDQIKATEKLSAQYRGLTSYYQAWQKAESAGSQRDMYEGIIGGLENIDDEISRGWLDDGTTEFLRLIYGDDLSAVATTKELANAYKQLDDNIKGTTHSIRDFFTVDDDGNSTNTGVYNFLDAVDEKFGGNDIVERDGKGNIIGFDFKVAGGDKAIADALGISEELVQIMVRAADDAGFVVSMDGTYQQLDILKEKAKEAAEDLKKINITDHTFFADGSKDSIEKDYQEALKIWEGFAKNKNADGTVNMSVEGAEEAFTLISTLQSMVDRLSEPAYMELDSSQVEKDMQTPLSKLQEYERLVQTENQLKLKGTDTTEIDKSKEEILDYFEGLSPEIKADLGIKDLSREEIQQKLEAGEFDIKATVDLQVEMNNTLRDLVNVGLLNAGIINKEQLEQRVDVSLYAGDVDTSDVEDGIDDAIENEGKKTASIEKIVEITGRPAISNSINFINDIISKYTKEDQQVVIEFLADTRSFDDFSTEDQEVIVKFLAETIDVDGYTPEEKEAYVKYLVDGGNLDAYTPEEKTAIAKYLADTGEPDSYTPAEKTAIAKFLKNSSEVDSYTPEQKQAIAKFIKDSIDVDNYQMPTNKQAFAKYLKDTHDIDVWTPPVKDGEASYTPSLASTSLPSITGLTAWYTPKLTGGGKVNGTANVDGTAFANGTTGRAFKRGDWSTKDSGVALGGELGQETIVRNGKFFTIGDDGAEFFQYRKGDIIFNHRQTEELFKNGKVTSGGGRGKAFAQGTAFASGSTGSGGIGKYAAVVIVKDSTAKKEVEKAVKSANLKPNLPEFSKDGIDSKGSTGEGEDLDVDPKPKNKNKKGGGGKGNSDKKDDFEETFDWIEVKIDRIERAIDQLDIKVNSVYQAWSERNKALLDEIGKVREEIDIQQAGYERYLEEANSVGLSEDWAEKVRDGKIDIESITDKDLAEKIKKYKEWYDKALDCRDAVAELKEKESELYKQRVENVATQYEGILGVIEHEKNMLDGYISQSEAQAWLVSSKYYEALVKNEREAIEELENQRAEMLMAFTDAMDSGTIAEGSEAYYEMVASIDEVTLSIQESQTALLEYNQTVQQLKWEQFDWLQEKISSITEETQFLIDLMSNDKLFEDNGQLTNEGSATMGLHGVSYNVYMAQADQAAAEAERLKKELAKDPYDKELEERYREMISLQQEHILSAEGEKDAIKELVEEGISLELEALEELIDKKNEQLESEKDLYEYSKKVKEQTKEIASLEKQMSAYQGDDSEEAKAKIQELKVSLEEAKADLEEAEYDKLIDDSAALLDELYLEYETILNTRLDNIDALISDMIAEINADSSIIGDTIREVADSVGYTLSSSMETIWNENELSTKNVITTYGDKFVNAQTTTNNALAAINMSLQNMIAQLDKKAATNTKKASTSSVAKSSSTSKTTATKKTTTKKSGGDGVPKIGDKVKYVSGQYYYDSQGKKPLGSHKKGGYVYITNINTKDWATHGYHISTGNKLGKGDLGWLKLNQISGYESGAKKILSDELAWTQENGTEFIVRPSDGAILTPVSKNDKVFNANASSNLWNMANSPAKFIKDNLNLSADNVPNNSTIQSNYTQYLDKVVFNLPNVKNYEELLFALKDDRRFEKLVTAMTIDKVAGKSGLAKGKVIK